MVHFAANAKPELAALIAALLGTTLAISPWLDSQMVECKFTIMFTERMSLLSNLPLLQ